MYDNNNNIQYLSNFFFVQHLSIYYNLLFSRFNYATYYMICTNTQSAQEIFISFFLSSLTSEKKDTRNKLFVMDQKRNIYEDDKKKLIPLKRKLCQCISY